MIAVVFLLVVELSETVVGDAGPRELVKVTPIDSTILGSERTVVVEPARTVGWELASSDVDNAGTELEATLRVELEG